MTYFNQFWINIWDQILYPVIWMIFMFWPLLVPLILFIIISHVLEKTFKKDKTVYIYENEDRRFRYLKR